MNEPANKVRFDDEKLADDYEKRMPVTEIAEEYSCSTGAVYRRLRELGIVRSRSEAAKGHVPHNRKGRYRDSQGYIYIQLRSDSPLWAMSNYAGYVREHRLVMARQLERPLERWEVVHHKNGIKDDNRPGNLVLFPSQLPTQ